MTTNARPPLYWLMLINGATVLDFDLAEVDHFDEIIADYGPQPIQGPPTP